MDSGARRHRPRLARDRSRRGDRPALETLGRPRRRRDRRRTRVEHASDTPRAAPEVQAVDGTAESIPFGDASVDAVVVGNAFHHFDRETAFAEIRRVQRPGGTLASFWASMLEEQFLRYPWMQEVDAVVEATRASNAIATAYRTWKEPPAAAIGFGPFERREFPVTHTVASARIDRSLRNLERRGISPAGDAGGTPRPCPRAFARTASTAAPRREERGRRLLPRRKRLEVAWRRRTQILQRALAAARDRRLADLAAEPDQRDVQRGPEPVGHHVVQ